MRLILELFLPPLVDEKHSVANPDNTTTGIKPSATQYAREYLLGIACSSECFYTLPFSRKAGLPYLIFILLNFFGFLFGVFQISSSWVF